ncbi:MAG: ThiF family adenylyltransferase [Desulfopila sp.]
MDTSLKELLDQQAQKRSRPDGTSYFSLFHDGEKALAEQTGQSLKNIQIAALENDIIPERYCRNQDTLDSRQQIKLLNSHVVVIGQGGLGGAVTEILARIGVGALTLVDGDVFEESNLNRQLLSTMQQLGKNKAEAGRDRVKEINPAVDVTCVTAFLDNGNSSEIICGSDLAVDCLDSVHARFVLEKACRDCQIPMISAAIGGTAGQLMVIFPGDVGLRQMYGDPDTAKEKGAETRLGTPPYTAVFMAAMECAEAVSILCRTPSSRRNSILLADIEDRSLQSVSFS